MAIPDRSKFMKYLNERPQSHGLFTNSDQPIVLEKVAAEIGNHSGNIWTHIVSLKREDAERMNYNTLSAWRNLVERQINNIAIAQKISLKNLKWYAAFHDKEANPHVHIVVYSTDKTEGFLTNKGIEKIRSGFANDIYKNELQHIYQKQTIKRNALKSVSSDKIMRIMSEIDTTSVGNELSYLIVKLKKQLQNTEGKKVYGYLPKNVKAIVNDIVKLMSSDPEIQEMYKEWSELEREKHAVYSGAKIDVVPLESNNVFKSIKNEIVRSVDELDDIIISDFKANVNSFSKIISTDSDNNCPEITAVSLILLRNLAGLIESDYHKKANEFIQIDRKVKQKTAQKKQALGIKEEQDYEISQY